MVKPIGALFVLCFVLVAGCALPTGQTVSKNENPGLLFSGAPEGTIIFVDGIERGHASKYSKKLALAVIPGRHIVELRSEGEVVHREEIFVSGGAIRTITIP
jgi:hypothetical protein